MIDWRLGLPVLASDRVLLRELMLADAAAIFRDLCTPEVCEHVAAPPPAVEGVERMITRGLERRRRGQAFSFGIQPAGSADVAGLMQFVSTRNHESQDELPSVWELGFALAPRYWGAGVIGEAGRLALHFAFEQVKLEGVEAWIAAKNHRANRALEKLGGMPDERRATRAPDGRVGDFIVWTIRRLDAAR